MTALRGVNAPHPSQCPNCTGERRNQRFMMPAMDGTGYYGTAPCGHNWHSEPDAATSHEQVHVVADSASLTACGLVQAWAICSRTRGQVTCPACLAAMDSGSKGEATDD